MTTPGRNLWTRLPITLRASIVGFLIAAIAANVWLLLLLNLGVQLAAVIEAIFLAFSYGGRAEGVPQVRSESPVPGRSATISWRPGSGCGALSRRCSLPRQFMPQLSCCSGLCITPL